MTSIGEESGWDPHAGRIASLGRGKNEGPENLVFGVGSVAGRDAHFCDITLQHVGAVRWRIAPSGKGFGQSVVAGGYVSPRRRCRVTGCLQPLRQWRLHVVVELVALRHRLRLSFRNL